MKKTILSVIVLVLVLLIIGLIYYKNFVQNEDVIEKKDNKTEQFDSGQFDAKGFDDKIFDNYTIDEKQGTFKVDLGGGGR